MCVCTLFDEARLDIPWGLLVKGAVQIDLLCVPYIRKWYVSTKCIAIASEQNVYHLSVLLRILRMVVLSYAYL